MISVILALLALAAFGYFIYTRVEASAADSGSVGGGVAASDDKPVWDGPLLPDPILGPNEHQR